MIAYAPLGSPGRPPERMHDKEPELLSEPAITEIAGKMECSPAQVLLAYAITRRTAAIPKSTDLDHMKENLEAHDLKIDREDLRKLIVLSKYIDKSFFSD